MTGYDSIVSVVWERNYAQPLVTYDRGSPHSGQTSVGSPSYG